jgi:hypothetical protein
MSELKTGELVLVDGANGVTRAPREGFPLGGWSMALAVLVACIVASRLRREILAAAACLSTLAGWWQLAVVRADAPLRRPEMAETVAASLAELQRTLQWPFVASIEEKGDVPFPLARYAAPTRGPGRVIEVRGESLALRCREQVCAPSAEP